MSAALPLTGLKVRTAKWEAGNPCLQDMMDNHHPGQTAH